MTSGEHYNGLTSFVSLSYPLEPFKTIGNKVTWSFIRPPRANRVHIGQEESTYCTRNNFVRDKFARNNFALNNFARNSFARNNFARNNFARHNFARHSFARHEFARHYFARNNFGLLILSEHSST